jgi:hypothetical protein
MQRAAQSGKGRGALRRTWCAADTELAAAIPLLLSRRRSTAHVNDDAGSRLASTCVAAL